MEEFKIRHFENENPGQSFPRFRTIGPEESERLLERWRAILGLGAEATPLVVLKEFSSRMEPLDGVNAESEDFDLEDVFRAAGLPAEGSILVNWYRFDQVDEMECRELFRFFDDIWYPGPDDIDIFDETFRWAVEITHFGSVSIARFVGS